MKRKIAFILITVLLVGMTSVFAEDFSDISGHWAEKEIISAQKTEIVNGDGTGRFRPNDTVTRAEFLKMLTAMIVPKLGLSDVPEEYKTENNWYSKYYNFSTAVYLRPDEENEINGINPGLFKDDASLPIERWEMAYMAGSMLENMLYMTPTEDLSFNDKSEIEKLSVSKYVILTADSGVIRGGSDGNFNPYAIGSRAEAAVIVLRMNEFIDDYIETETAKQEEEYNKILAEYDAKLKTYSKDEIPTKNVKVKFTMDTGKHFVVELYPDYAPQTVANFVNLVQSGFYNGLTFHRVVDGFIAQGGDPNGDGSGGADNYILGEFSANGVTSNTLSHTEGVISMARSSIPNSASSQFFICFDDASFLDGSYAAFGKVISGMEVVKDFTKVEREINEMGEVAVPKTPIVIRKAEVIK